MSINGDFGEEERFKIIHIPHKPFIPPHLQPTVNVYAADIEPQHANTLIRKLNKVAPLESLRHVKRIRKKTLDGGKMNLSMILSMACGDGDQFDEMPDDIIELVNSFQLSTFVTKVSKYAATTKEDWEEQCKLWPTSYHPPTYNIDGITGFDEEDSHSVVSFMKEATVLAQSGTHQMVNAAIIVDPSTKQVIATALDQVFSCASSSNKSNMEASYSDHQMLTANCSSDEPPKHSHHNAACVHPWKWAEQQLQDFSSSWHPLRHAAIVAIEYAAVRDRKLFPSNGHIGNNFVQDDYIMSSSTLGSPLKKHKINLPEVPDDENQDSETKGSHSDSTRPYLCTDYDIYLVWEPCAMCAMALVHQRIKRIFFAFPNPYAGALGSVHRLQGEKSLNHHYAVFRVLLPEERPLGDDVQH